MDTQAEGFVRDATPRLLVGDLAVIGFAMLAGMVRHDANPIALPARAAATVGPFLIGWVALAALLDSYDYVTPTEAIRTAAGTWIGTANVGLIARNSPPFPGGTTHPFPLVVTGTVLVALLAWRAVAHRHLVE